MRYRETIVAILLILVAASLLAPRPRDGPRGRLAACIQNVKTIGTALEMYSTDPSGRFPTALSDLTPNYLKRIPTCPAVGTDTYSPGYKGASSPDAYTVVCMGSNHPGLVDKPNVPTYTSTQGLVKVNSDVEGQMEQDRKDLGELERQIERQCNGQDREHVMEFCRQNGIEVVREDTFQVAGQAWCRSPLVARHVYWFGFDGRNKCDRATVWHQYGTEEPLPYP